jgi:GNAT superfamily N-acetyltransferase
VTPTHPDWTTTEVHREALQMPRRTQLRLPDTQVIDRDDLLQVITPSLRHGGLNEVAFCRFEPAVADHEIDLALERFYAAHVRFRWTVAPDCGPIDLAQRLQARGLRCTRVLAVARFLAPTVNPLTPSIERVTSGSLAAYTQVMAEGWGHDAASLHEVSARTLATPGYALYLSRLDDGTPAAASAAIVGSRSVYLLGAVVLPPYRGRGLYRASVERRLADAAQLGCTLAVSHAVAKTSAPSLLRAGFHQVYAFDSFHPA